MRPGALGRRHDGRAAIGRAIAAAALVLGAACGGDAGARGADGTATPRGAPGGRARGGGGGTGVSAGEVVAGAPAAASPDVPEAALVEEALAAGDADLAADWRAAVGDVATVDGPARTTVASARGAAAPAAAAARASRPGPSRPRAARERRIVVRTLPRAVAIPALPDLGPPGRPTVPLDEPETRRSGLLDHWAEPPPAIPATPAKPSTGGGALRRAARWLVGRERAEAGGAREGGAPRAPQGTGEPGPARPRQPVP